jgi:voltage-gated potassium channel Kch
MNHLNSSGPSDGAPYKRPTAGIGVIGLGRMGQAFSELLISSGGRVVVYDRDGDRVPALAPQCCWWKPSRTSCVARCPWPMSNSANCGAICGPDSSPERLRSHLFRLATSLTPAVSQEVPEF